MAKRGRQPQPCPDPHELRVAYAFDQRLVVVARQMDSNPKTVRRWLAELGIAVPPPKKIRPRGVTPPYVKVATLSSGRRKAPKLYMVWDGMWSRCVYPRAKSYNRYGGRGIYVCPEWNDYDAFRKWAIAAGFRKGLSLDRIDSDGNYEPGNCRWTSAAEQQWTTCRTIHLTHNGVTKSLPEWADELGMPRETLRTRRSNGWTDEQILTTPILARGHMRPGIPHKPRGRAALKAKRLLSQSSAISSPKE